jgi:ABC-2 type transport system ATP-binding protein
MSALDIAGVSHSYGRKAALAGVDLSIGEGGFCVLLGLNGAGKTTLFSLIAGLLSLQSGSIRVFGHTLPRERQGALARSGFVFQQPALDLDLTVNQTLRYHAALHGLSRREAELRIAEELARFGLLDRVDDVVRTLSGGQRRRVEIARSLLHRPGLLLLDEPTVGLDVPSRRVILERVRALSREKQAAVLWATHLLDEVSERDRMVVIHGGRIVDDGLNDPSVETLSHRFARLVGLEAAA